MTSVSFPSVASGPETDIDLERSNEMQARLHDLVPGGAHTYARGSDQYPERMAPVLDRGRGARVWDVDGNSYVEYGMGLRAVTLGHAYEPINAAVRDVLDRGVNFSRPHRLELEAAEDFLRLVPGADMVKFCKNGSDATTAALKLARAATGRDVVAMADQPFFSTDDWFIGRTAMNAGIPASVREGTVRFAYNDLDSLRALFDAHPDRIAAVFMEAATALGDPAPGFLEGVRELCTARGAVLVFDEMITGFRWSEHGAQGVFGVTPDLSTWGKAMGNGFPISALAGRRDLMELGGLRTDAERVFLLSTTHGPETVGLTAFRAVVEAYRREDPVATMRRQGTRLAEAANEVVAAAGLAEYVDVAGHPSCLVFRTRDAHGAPSQEMRTVFLAELLRRGVLGQSFVISAAHTDDDVDHTVAAVAGALPAYERALTDGVETVLEGRPVAPALRAHAAPRRL
jgi:glutamate-1-semialdehyde 2,1-aminomutase